MSNLPSVGVIVCPSCSAANSEHASVCVSCKSYLQNRVVNLDLFSTVWGVIEHPLDTMRLIARAEHKNFALFLAAMGGMLPLAQFLHFYRVGESASSLTSVIAITMLIGPVVGLVSGLAFGLVGSQLGVLGGGDRSFRNTLSAFAYALVPSTVIGLLTMPIQWLTFGMHQFTSNPHPATINALSHWTLSGLQYGGEGWSLILIFAGMKVSLRAPVAKSAVATLIATAAVLGSSWWGLTTLLKVVHDTTW